MAQKQITTEEKKLLLAILAERKARGRPLPEGFVVPQTKSDNKWNQDDDGYFIKRDGAHFKPRPELENFIKSDARFILLRSGRGGGKALWVETPILTANRGWQTMGSVKIGDVVFDENGRQCIVFNKSDIMYDHKCYSVGFSDGSSIIADAEHLWFTQSKKERNSEVKSVGKVRTTEEMIKNITIGNRMEKNYSIRTCRPIEYPEKELPIHPYVFGVWLGDGNSRSAKITTADQEILDELEAVGVSNKKLKSAVYEYGIYIPGSENVKNKETGRIQSSPQNLTHTLGKMGVLLNKHIPKEYLTASIEQRLELLQGLMDTDGTADQIGHCSYVTTSQKLFTDVLELCIGLGIKAGYFVDTAYLYRKDGTRKDCGDCYNICINTDLPIFKLPRKLNRLLKSKKQAKRHEQRFIVSIMEHESVPVQCISVNSPNHLYLAGKNLIPTHNSVAGFQKGLLKIKQGLSGAVLAPDFEQFKTSTWEGLRDWLPWNMVVPRQRFRQSESWEATRPFTMVFMNGARIYCKGLKDPESARGSNINWLMYDEGRRDPTGLGWKNAIAAVRIGNKPQAWSTTTPANSQHWTSTFFNGKITPELMKILEDVGADRTQELFKIFETSIEKNKENLDPMFYASIIASYPSGYLRAREVEGRVADEEGSLGDRTWFDGKILPSSPDWVATQVRFWDLAGTEKKMTPQGQKNDPDETMGTLLGTDTPKERFCIEDQIGGTWAWKTIKQNVVAVAKQDGPSVKICFEQEPGSGGKNQVAELIDEIRKELPGYDVSGLEAKKLGDRVLAANTWFGEAANGLWYMVKGAWNEPFLGQLDYFPNPAIHDDRITSVSGGRHKIAPIRKWKKIQFLAVGQNESKEKREPTVLRLR